MSIVEELGAQVRAAADELPVALVTEALDRLRQAADRLRWVRQESADPMGVPELSVATEHAETAGHVLRVAQDQLAAYLAAIGLAGDGPPTGQPQRREQTDDPPTGGPGPVPEPRGGAGPVHRWWSVRVTELTGRRDAPTAKPDRDITDAEELLRRVAERVRAGDRGQLHTATARRTGRCRARHGRGGTTDAARPGNRTPGSSTPGPGPAPAARRADRQGPRPAARTARRGARNGCSAGSAGCRHRRVPRPRRIRPTRRWPPAYSPVCC